MKRHRELQRAVRGLREIHRDWRGKVMPLEEARSRLRPGEKLVVPFRAIHASIKTGVDHVAIVPESDTTWPTVEVLVGAIRDAKAKRAWRTKELAKLHGQGGAK